MSSIRGGPGAGGGGRDVSVLHLLPGAWPGRGRGRPGVMAGRQVGGSPVAAVPAGVEAVIEVHEILR